MIAHHAQISTRSTVSAPETGSLTVMDAEGGGLRSSSADPDSQEWLRVLGAPDGPEHEAGLDRLNQLLLRIARSEVRRRRARTPIAGPELDDLAVQAADDAMLSILSRIGTFRGESRFTTWAYSFVMFEVSGKIGRHYWKNALPSPSAEDWEQLPARLDADPSTHAEASDLVAAVREAVGQTLTAHQRKVFVALVLDGVPLDALAIELGANRNSIYKVMFDARRKIRAHLVAHGHLVTDGAEQP
jgi:RNA polymerase sigma-70 factor (ECF subfamily)